MNKCIDCGKKILVESKRCIVCHNKSPEMRDRPPHNFVDLVGKVFGKLTVVEFTIKKWGEQRLWKCSCECGKIIYTNTTKLKSGHTKSCGCHSRERATTHGESRTRFYDIYRCAKSRCNNRNHSKWHLYGGKGIKFLWDSFQGFKTDMYASYEAHVKKFGEKDTTIDRINGNDNYCKENCRWATRLEQARNTENVKHISFNGMTKTLGSWSEIIGMRKRVLYNRIFELGWPIEKALTTPIKK